MELSPVGIAAAVGGTILLYSGVKGKSVSSAIRSVLMGKSPAQAASANALATGGTNVFGGTQSSVQVGTPGPGEAAWVRTFLTSIGAPSTNANIRSVEAWIAHEGPFGTQGANNPLNTTIETTGATGKFAGTPVTNYDTPTHGLAAIVTTLLDNQAYGDVVAALRNGNGLCGQTYSGLSEWSGGGYSQVC